METIKGMATAALVAVLIASISGCFYYRRTDVDSRPPPPPYYAP
jgi:hypothetical protein